MTVRGDIGENDDVWTEVDGVHHATWGGGDVVIELEVI